MNTSSPAAATLPESSAAIRSSSTMISPRAQFTMRTPGFIFANAAAFNMPRVCSVTGMWTRDEIRIAINGVQLSGEFHAERLRAGLGEKRIIAYDPHPEGEGALGHFRPDAAHAEDAERFAGEFHALKLFPIPFARRHGGVGLGKFARETQDHGERQFRRGDRVARGRVHHHDAALGGGFNIHIVHAHAGASDDAELGRGFEHVARHLGFGANDHRHRVGHDGQQFGFGQTLGQNDDLKFRSLLEQGDSFGGNRITNQYLHSKTRREY